MKLMKFIGIVIVVLNSSNAAATITLDEMIETNLSAPTFLASPPGDDRLFVSERSGAIKVFDSTGQFIGTFMTVPGVNTSGEGGLLGFAFDPSFTSNGYFYVSYTGIDSGGFATIIERFQVSADPNVANSSAPKRIITIAQPNTNHNAGWIGFNPVDEYLYIPLGDGGGGHDFYENGQDTNTLLGSVLRLDVHVAEPQAYAIPTDNPFVNEPGRDEIWAYGVRNPWRAGFDRQTGEFYFGDVGQRTWEEVNRGEAGGNFGWPLREGLVATPTGTVGGALDERVDPIHVYANPVVGRSIVGGVVYRGPVAALRGKYLFAEFYTGDIWALDLADNSVELLSNMLSYDGQPIAFSEDDDGNVYLVDIGGRVYRFGGEPVSATKVAVPVLPYGFTILLLLLSLLVCSRARMQR